MTDYQKNLKQLIRVAKKQGWTVSRNGHVKFRGPEGQVVFCSASPRCSRASINVTKDLQRAGLKL
jgi:hypothetical protein